jgi:uncharacterized NAD(P)/FAD-binding protein YdhS
MLEQYHGAIGHNGERSARRESSAETAPLDSVIVGGGCSGVLVALELLRRSTRISVGIVEPANELGPGLAYGGESGEHLLNVATGNMSAFHDQEDHFLDWIREHVDGSVRPEQYVLRKNFGRYLGEVLWSTARKSRIEGAGLQYLSRPWQPGWTAQVRSHALLVILGTGLTAVDHVIALNKAGFRGEVVMVSRHGKLPGVHAESARHAENWRAIMGLPLVDACRIVRAGIKRASLEGVAWQAVIDSLRPHTREIWEVMNLKDRKRFLRHLKCHWDTARHRMAPETMSKFVVATHRMRVRIMAARFRGVCSRNGRQELVFAERRTGDAVYLPAEMVLNCSGTDLSGAAFLQEPIRGLIAGGLIKPDLLKMGLSVTPSGALVDSSDRIWDNLFAVGALCRGVFWETTAVPEIRQQAAVLASELLRVISAERAPRAYAAGA